MAITPSHLASGQISSTKGAILTSAASTTTEVTKCVLTNTTATIQTVTFYRDDGNERILVKVKVPAGAGKSVTVQELVGAKLNATNSIKAECDNNNKVNYQIDGKLNT